MGNTPNIRFIGFTDDWEQRKLGELSSSFEYGLNAAAKEYDGENKYIRITDIDDDSREFKQEDITSPDTDLSSAENYRLSEGDILLARTGASVGKSYIYKASDGLVYYAGFLIRARIKPEYNSEFVFQNTLTGDYEKFIKVTSMRSGQPGVNAQEYSQYQIMVPSKPEQDKISDCLRNLDNLITLHQRKCDEMKKMKKFMLQKMFPKNGQKNPEIRFDGFTDDWEQRKFSDVVEIGSGMDYKHLGEGDIPVYGTGGYMLSVDSALSEEKDAIGIGRKGTIDKPYILRAPFWTVDTLFYCIPKENHDLDFINCLFQTVDWKKKDESTGVPSLSKVIINNVEAVVPSFDEQKKIGEYFNNLDHLITLHQRKVENLKNLKKYMLQNMFV
jgi:type I restriction enzyme S subunit